MGDTEPNITGLLHAAANGSRESAERLIGVVYDDLRALAAHRMADAPPGHSLQPTALVNECYLRLVGRRDTAWKDRRHFFALAARAMHDILVERARRHMAQKRGGDRPRVHLSDAPIDDTTSPGELLALSEAIEKLQEKDPLSAEVIVLRFFGGLTHEQIASTLELPLIRIRREWQYGKAFLLRALGSEREP